jgi:hypothetical protein
MDQGGFHEDLEVPRERPAAHFPRQEVAQVGQKLEVRHGFEADITPRDAGAPTGGDR